MATYNFKLVVATWNKEFHSWEIHAHSFAPTGIICMLQFCIYVFENHPVYAVRPIVGITYISLHPQKSQLQLPVHEDNTKSNFCLQKLLHSVQCLCKPPESPKVKLIAISLYPYRHTIPRLWGTYP